eukprot:scaffold317746_cov28-Tisochrysis_lutea.AAC.1
MSTRGVESIALGSPTKLARLSVRQGRSAGRIALRRCALSNGARGNGPARVLRHEQTMARCVASGRARQNDIGARHAAEGESSMNACQEQRGSARVGWRLLHKQRGGGRSLRCTADQ